MKCPYCAGKLEAAAHNTLGEPDQVTVTVEIPERFDLENTIRGALLLYWRWVSEGKHPYGSSSTRDRRLKQYYYDTYHNGISFDSGTKIYHFRIQLSDSPYGDEWISGEFKVPRGVEIEIISQNSYTS